MSPSKLALLLLFACNLCYGYKILVYSPKFGTSHVNFMGKLADILVKAGHEVVMYLPQVLDDVYTNGTKLARVIYRARDFDVPATNHGWLQAGMWTGNNEGYLNMKIVFNFVSTCHGNLCKAQFKDTALMDQLKAEKFDLALGENFDLCYYGVLRRIGVKNYITVFSTTQYENAAMALGIPSTPSFVPGIFNGMKPPFTYLQRTTNLIAHLFSWQFLHTSFGGPANSFLKTIYGKDFEAMDEMAKSTLYIVNADEHVDFPRPISHKIIYVGGIGKVQSRPLDKQFEEIMKNAKKGVILVSFGTVARATDMPDETKKVLLETFSNFPDVTFLWKYEDDSHEVAKGYPNIITSKWLPQNDLLDHPRLLGFVSHGGMNSVQEGASKGAPMIMIPLFHDQMRNSESLAYRKMAIVLEKKSLNVESFTEALRKIIEDDSYRKNAKRLAAMIAAKPMSAEERVVKYTEFAAKFGPDLNLDMYGRNLNFVQFYCLDIIIPALLFIFVFLWVVFKLFLYILRKFLKLLGVSKKKVE